MTIDSNTETPSTETTPNPGSNEAVEQGCICPRVDNGWGQGVLMVLGGLEAVRFVTNLNCPLHGTGPQDDDGVAHQGQAW